MDKCFGRGCSQIAGFGTSSDFLSGGSSLSLLPPDVPYQRSPMPYRPITSKLMGFKLLCSYSSGYRPAQPTAQSISPAPQQPDLYPPAISGRSRRNPGHGEDTTRGRPEHTTVTFGTSHPDVTHKTPHCAHLQDPSSGGR